MIINLLIVNAYYLIYVCEELTFNPNDIPMRTYSLYEDGRYLKDYYGKLCSDAHIFQKIGVQKQRIIVSEEQPKEALENLPVEAPKIPEEIPEIPEEIPEISEYLMEFIIQYYHKKYAFNSNMIRQINKKEQKFYFLNFCIFLRFHGKYKNDQKKFEKYSNWHLMNACIREEIPNGPDLRCLDKFSVISQFEINEVISELNKNEYKSVDLHMNMDNYDSLIQDYRKQIECITIATYFIKKACDKKYNESLFGALYLQKIDNVGNSKKKIFNKFSKDLFKLMILHFCRKLHESLKDRNEKEVSSF